MRRPGIFASALAAVSAVIALPVQAQKAAEDTVEETGEDTVEAKLSYVASIYPDGIFYCRVIPRSRATSETLIAIDFMFEEAGPLDALVVVTGQVRGQRYSARMTYSGHAAASQDDPGDAEIVLDTITEYDADPLPDGASWSSPEGDVISLRVERYRSMGPQPYILVGTQDTEFGINDLRCLEGNRAAQR